MSALSAAEPIAIPAIDPEGLVADPHAAFAALRAQHPVIRLGEMHYLVLRAGDVLALVTDPRTRQIDGPDYVRMIGVPDGFAARALRDVFLFDNDASHRAKRGLFAQAFSHAAIRAKRGEVRAVADRIVAGLPRGEAFDFVDRMAARVPAEMIAAILGLPAEEVEELAPLVYSVARAVSPIYPHDAHAGIEDAMEALHGYVADHLHIRLVEPQDDLLSRVADAWQQNPVIPFASLVNQVIGIIIGGIDTTRAAFAMLVALLVDHPGAWQALRENPSLVPGAVAEGLRYEPSVGSIIRFTTEPLLVGGANVPAGAALRLSTMSAMRDPALYAEPERFDITRTDHPRLHAVFGMGPHRCIGELLARIEMEESLAALLAGAERLDMELAPRMTGFGGIRQISAMRVRIR